MSKHKALANQVIVITGASSGIGLCTALMAGNAGAKLVLVARSAETLETLADNINRHGGDAIAVVADVGIKQDVDHVTETAIAKYGRIDTWINDAGVGIYARLDEVFKWYS